VVFVRWVHVPGVSPVFEQLQVFRCFGVYFVFKLLVLLRYYLSLWGRHCCFLLPQIVVLDHFFALVQPFYQWVLLLLGASYKGVESLSFLRWIRLGNRNYWFGTFRGRVVERSSSHLSVCCNYFLFVLFRTLLLLLECSLIGYFRGERRTIVSLTLLFGNHLSILLWWISLVACLLGHQLFLELLQVVDLGFERILSNSYLVLII